MVNSKHWLYLIAVSPNRTFCYNKSTLSIKYYNIVASHIQLLNIWNVVHRTEKLNLNCNLFIINVLIVASGHWLSFWTMLFYNINHDTMVIWINWIICLISKSRMFITRNLKEWGRCLHIHVKYIALYSKFPKRLLKVIYNFP